MFGLAMQVTMLLVVLAILIDNVRTARRARDGQADMMRLLTILITARMRKGDFRCYCGGTLMMGEAGEVSLEGIENLTALKCERCKALILLPIKEGQRVED